MLKSLISSFFIVLLFGTHCVSQSLCGETIELSFSNHVDRYDHKIEIKVPLNGIDTLIVFDNNDSLSLKSESCYKIFATMQFTNSNLNKYGYIKYGFKYDKYLKFVNAIDYTIMYCIKTMVVTFKSGIWLRESNGQRFTLNYDEVYRGVFTGKCD